MQTSILAKNFKLIKGEFVLVLKMDKVKKASKLTTNLIIRTKLIYPPGAAQIAEVELLNLMITLQFQKKEQSQESKIFDSNYRPNYPKKKQSVELFLPY
jgi:hypothetical protein